MHTFRKPLVFLSSVLLISFLSGCAVLTENQIKAVNRFAKATENYGTTPSAAIRTWAELNITTAAAEVTTYQSEEAMWEHVNTSFETYERIIDRSERATKAFEVLDRYSKLLKQLTADNYTEALDTKSKDLGDALDSAVESYNSRFGSSISTFGGVAAGMIRGAGGLYIRAEQSKALKKVVENADPAIEEFTKAIITTTNAVELGIDKEINGLQKELKATLKYAPYVKVDSPEGTSKRKIIPDLASYVRAFELVQRGRKAKQVVGNAKIAAKKYRKVHEKLFKDTRDKKENMDDLIEMIEALKVEIDAGLKVKKSFDD